MSYHILVNSQIEHCKTTQTLLDVTKYHLNKGINFFWIIITWVWSLLPREYHALSWGTINPNTVGIPINVRQKERCNKFKRGGSIKVTKDDMFLVTWKYTEEVYLSTIIPGFTGDSEVKWRKKTGDIVTVNRQNVVKLYNAYMAVSRRKKLYC